MNADQIEKLKALALAAGGEEWSIDERSPDYEVTMGADDYMIDTSYYPVAPSVEKARFIAASNPATVLELIAEVERLRAELAAGAARQGGGTCIKALTRYDSFETDEGDELRVEPTGRWVRYDDLESMLGSAPAAGTEKDAERWRMFMEALKGSSGAAEVEWFTRIMDEACAMHGQGKEAIFSAIGAQMQALGQHQEKP